MTQSIGVSKVREPRHIVPIQLKNFTPVGTAIRNVIKEKKARSTCPLAYIWCAQTATDSAAIAIVAAIRPLYPKIGFRLKTGRISVAIPKKGSAKM
jgi:hypothetical protein